MSHSFDQLPDVSVRVCQRCNQPYWHHNHQPTHGSDTCIPAGGCPLCDTGGPHLRAMVSRVARFVAERRLAEQETDPAMTLADFLLARIAETEEYWRARRPRELDRKYIDIVLAECDVKRRIIDWHTRWYGGEDPEPGDQVALTVKLLALPYADHPAYRPEWRP